MDNMLRNWLSLGRARREKRGDDNIKETATQTLLEKMTAELLLLVSEWAKTRRLNAYVIGLPVREAHSGVSLETCLSLGYEDKPNGAPKWNKYVYTDEEAQEDDGVASVTVDIMGGPPLSERDKETWNEYACQIRAALPKADFHLM